MFTGDAKRGKLGGEAAVKSILPALGGDIGGEVRHASLDDFPNRR